MIVLASLVAAAPELRVRREKHRRRLRLHHSFIHLSLPNYFSCCLQTNLYIHSYAPYSSLLCFLFFRNCPLFLSFALNSGYRYASLTTCHSIDIRRPSEIAVACHPSKMAYNTSVVFDMPPLPSYTLTPRPPVLAPIPDNILALILPIVAYWGLSMVYHYLDIYDLFPQYRLHTPAELTKRNHVKRWEVVRDVLLQQVVQTLAGVAVGYFDEVECTGKEEYEVAVWARRLRFVQKAVPTLLGLFGIDALGLAKNLSTNGHTALAGALAGGKYPGAIQSIILESGLETVAPAFTEWEMTAANFIYWYSIPFIQFTWAITVVDTWQYFWHRAMHLNRWLYGKSASNQL